MIQNKCVNSLLIVLCCPEEQQRTISILLKYSDQTTWRLVSVSLLKVRDHKRSLHHFLLSTFPHWSSHPLSHVVCSAPSLSPLQLLPVNSAEVLQLPPFVSWHKLSVSSRSDPFVLHYSWSSLSAYSSSRMPSVYPSIRNSQCSRLPAVQSRRSHQHHQEFHQGVVLRALSFLQLPNSPTSRFFPMLMLSFYRHHVLFSTSCLNIISWITICVSNNWNCALNKINWVYNVPLGFKIETLVYF